MSLYHSLIAIVVIGPQGPFVWLDDLCNSSTLQTLKEHTRILLTSSALLQTIAVMMRTQKTAPVLARLRRLQMTAVV